MLLGKRPRPPMKRTTSMTEITFDLNTTSNAEAPPADPHNPFNNYPKQPAAGLSGGVCGPQVQSNGGGVAVAGDGGGGGGGGGVAVAGDGGGGGGGGGGGVAVAGDGGGGLERLDQRLLAMVSPRVHRRHSANFMETPHFLRSCGLCRRRLVPGRDIYMYRGDSAFCSLECRQQQMKQDEKSEKCSIASKKQADTSSAARSSVSAKGETVVAM